MSTIAKATRFAALVGKNPLMGLRVAVNYSRDQLQTKLGILASRSEWLASAHYFLASTQFRREQQAVLSGKQAFLAADASRQRTSARLRRNTHRLEKGLIMQPRRDIFAEDYIRQTVLDYKRARSGGTLHQAECKWAGDVLAAYFACVGHTPVIDAARKEFYNINAYTDQCKFVPYPSTNRPKAEITFEQLNTLFQERRSTRWFEPRAVSRDLIEKAIDAASTAPSACNRQPYYYYVLDNPQRAAHVAGLAGGTGGFATNIPCLLVVVGDLSSYAQERDRHLIYIDASLANMQLMLALQTLGLSTCAINWPDIAARDRTIAAELGLADHERVVMLIAIGYAAPHGGIPFSQKKPHELLARYEERKGGS